jgi:hypothetical protein
MRTIVLGDGNYLVGTTKDALYFYRCNKPYRVGEVVKNHKAIRDGTLSPMTPPDMVLRFKNVESAIVILKQIQRMLELGLTDG